MTAINNSSLPINLLNSGTVPASSAASLNNGATDPASQSSGTASNASFGPAVNLDLSASAKAVVDGQQDSGSGKSPAPSNDSDGDATSDASAPAGGSAPTVNAAAPVTGSNGSSSLQYDPVAATVSSAKHRIQAQVGVVGANEVVDKSGNINKAQLARLIAAEQVASSSKP